MPETTATPARLSRRARRRIIWWSVAGVIVLLLACAAWIAVRALHAKDDLEAAIPLASKVQSQIASGDSTAAVATTRSLAQHAHAARDETSDPIWRAAEILPVIGGNLSAVRQVAWAASDVTDRSIVPLAKLAGTIDLSSFTPVDGKVQLKPLAAAAPTATRANAALQSDLGVVRAINTSGTVRPVADAVHELTDALGKAAAVTDVASRAARLLPAMLGADGPRNYVLVTQNNAEARATGGIVGALALLHTQDGKITLTRHASASDFPQLESPAVPLSAATRKLYGNITGRYIQDATLTPDFATSGELVRAMWQKRFGTKIDGVLSIDPVALSYILKATGPVDVADGEQLTSDNAVQVLLSETYARFSDPKQQDAFFAAAAAAVFTKVASGQFDTDTMLAALTQAGDERRVLLWNANKSEQAVLADTTLSGSLPTSSATDQRFGVYLNDATGGKMDYYLHTKVQLGQAQCRSDGRADYVVSVILSSSAPSDAATSLPWYVTGGGLSGVPAGDTHTTVAVYSPPGAAVVGVTTGGKNVAVQQITDAGHAVAHLQIDLTPGQTSTYEFQFVGATPKAGSSSGTSLDALVTPGVSPATVSTARVTCSEIGQ